MDHIGRIAQLHNLVSRPELNGAYAVIENFVADTDQYEVRVLSSPNERPADIMHLVNLSNFEFMNSETVRSMFPSAMTQKGNLLENHYEPGTILDFSDVDSESQPAADELRFRDSCCVVGADCSTNLLDRPQTGFLNKVWFFATNSEDVMECRNITLGIVICLRSDHITFRRCCIEQVLAVGSVSLPAKVLMESCVIESNSLGATVAPGSVVTMINCVISGGNTGIKLTDGAKAVLIHCTFIDCENGIVALNNNDVEMINCTFTACQRAVDVLNGGTIRMIGCRLEDCSLRGVCIEAFKKARVHIQNCVFTNCARGVLLSTGKIELTMVSTTFTHNEVYGVCFLMTISGSIHLTNCTFRNNANRDVFNLSGENCPVTIDNVVQECPTIVARAAQYKQVGPKVIYGSKDDTIDPPLRETIKMMRAMNFSGMTVCKIMCGNCQKEETADEKLKACSKCPYVVYCSRECQVAHWKVHKKDCGKD